MFLTLFYFEGASLSYWYPEHEWGGGFLIHKGVVCSLALPCAHAPNSGPQIHWALRSTPLHSFPKRKKGNQGTI